MTSCGLKRTFKQSTILSLPRDDWQTCALSLGFITDKYWAVLIPENMEELSLRNWVEYQCNMKTIMGTI